MSAIVFTRYLYIKDEVLLSLMLSLLNKKENALYWAYELYYSGFEQELFEHLWKIYYDFYYTLNPSFQDFFIKKYKEWKKSSDQKVKELVVATLVNNLLMRPYNLDVFMLRQLEKNVRLEKLKKEKKLESLLKKENYLEIAKYILRENCECIDIFVINILTESIAYFNKKDIKMELDKLIVKWPKISGYLNINPQLQVLAWVMSQFSLLHNLTMGKKLYMIVEPNEIIQFNTVLMEEGKLDACKVLPIAYKHKIDEFGLLHLFHLERNALTEPNGLRDLYWYHWTYYAYNSPVWLKRMEEFKGTLNHIKRKIEFPEEEEEDEEDEERDWGDEFYTLYGYEPDEQKQEVQDFSIQKIEGGKEWTEFYKEYGKNNLFVSELVFTKSIVY